jgi:inorganic pyrophosphatase
MHLPPPADKEPLDVVIETPRGSRNKYAFDPRTGLFRLKKLLPLGLCFPFDFGFVPGTRGGDGDPLDVIVLMQEASFPGCLVSAALLGVIQVKQRARGARVFQRNDRLVAVAVLEERPLELRSLAQVGTRRMTEIRRFFECTSAAEGRDFEVLGMKGPRAARKTIERARVGEK